MKPEMKSPAEWQALLTKKEAEIASLNRQVEWLTQQLRLIQGQRFGASSECTQVISEQMSLFNEAEALTDHDVPEPDQEQITYKRKKQVGKRKMDLSGLPVEQVVHKLPEGERVCPECGGPLKSCGTGLRQKPAWTTAISCFIWRTGIQSESSPSRSAIRTVWNNPSRWRRSFFPGQKKNTTKTQCQKACLARR